MDKDDLRYLPGTPQEQAWLRERLEALSAREETVLAAALMRSPPHSMEEAIGYLQSLDSYEVCFPAGSYEQLGEFFLRREVRMPEDILPHVDRQRLGEQYEDTHPGLFVGSCYVEYPKEAIEPAYHQGGPLPEDNDWSVKLKLASRTVPEGVWIRLPDHDGNMPEDSSEVKLALDALQVKFLEDCTLLEARCILPEAGDLMKQYDSLIELVREGDDLGFILEEQGKGKARWMEKFAAALKYEGCRTLRFALDISQNLNCYEWASCRELEELAANHLRSCGVPDELIQSGAIDLRGYAEDQLDPSEYILSSGEGDCVVRNGREFIREYSALDTPGMTMQ